MPAFESKCREWGFCRSCDLFTGGSMGLLSRHKAVCHIQRWHDSWVCFHVCGRRQLSNHQLLNWRCISEEGIWIKGGKALYWVFAKGILCLQNLCSGKDGTYCCAGVLDKAGLLSFRYDWGWICIYETLFDLTKNEPMHSGMKWFDWGTEDGRNLL